jgi:hypothetical protein
MFQKKSLIIGLILFVSAALVGCSSQEAEEDSITLAAPTSAALTTLAMADAKDGTSDKVVTKCASCKLGMDGKKEHAVKFGEYELHFCTKACKESFTKDPEKLLAGL